MKRLLAPIIILAGFTLTACSTNTRSENTLAGAASGAVLGALAGNAMGDGNKHGVHIAIGAAAGALIGAGIGHYINSTDHYPEHPILESNPVDPPKTWQDPKTYRSYTLIPTSNLYSLNGNPSCRDFRFVSIRYGTREQFDATACQMPDRQWVRVRG